MRRSSAGAINELLLANDAKELLEGSQTNFFTIEDGAVVNGKLTVPLRLAVNKLGHAMHDLDPAFETFSRTPELAAITADLGFGDPQLLQSMYIFKQPRISYWPTNLAVVVVSFAYIPYEEMCVNKLLRLWHRS